MYYYGSTNDWVVLDAVSGHVTVHTDGGYDRANIPSAASSMYFEMGDGNDLLNAIQGITNSTLIAGADQDTLNVTGGDYVLADGGDGYDLIQVSQSTHMTIDGGADDDSILAYNLTYSSVYGNDGDDSISVSGMTTIVENNTINGGAGNDSIYINPSTGSRFTIDGGAGDDYFLITSGNEMSIHGGEGNDTVSITSALSHFHISLDAGSDFMSIASDVTSLTVTGGDDNDTILSNASSVSIDGGDDNDSIVVGIGSTYTSRINNVIVDGGAGSDYIEFNSSATVGADSSIFGGDGNDTIVARIDNTFNIDAGEGDDSLSIIGGTQAEVSTGNGDDSLFTNNLGDSTLNTGDGKDYVSLYGDGVDNPAQTLLLETGDGDDTIDANTNDNYLTVNAGLGNDLINVLSGNQIIIHGNANDDTINVTSASITHSEIYGDAGDDYIYMTEGNYVTLDAGTGDDTIENHAGSVLILGGTGDDSIVSSGESATIDGGHGDDTIIAEGASLSIDANNGDDVVTVGGSDIVLFAGTGDDDIRVISGYNVLVDAQGDADTIAVDSGSLVTVYGGMGDDVISNSVNGALLVGGARIEDEGSGSGDSMSGSSIEGSSVEGSASFEDSLLSSGNDTIISSADNVSLFGGAGNDVISVSGSDNLIDGGDDRDEINLTDVYNSTVFAGNGNDSVIINNSEDVTVYGGEGNNEVSLNSGSNLLIITEDGNDSIDNTSAKYSTILAGNGNNYINSRQDGQFLYFEMGSGNDTVDNLSADSTILAGEGNDSVISRGNRNSIDVGDGSNYLQIGGESVTAVAGDGNDIVSLNYTSNSTLDVGDGNNSINSELDTREMLFFAGTGSDTVALMSMDSSTLQTGDGNDLVTLGGIGSNIVELGNGNDVIEIVNGEGNSIDAGSGNDLISFTSATMLGSDGSEVITTGSYNAGDTTIIGGAGNDTIYGHDEHSDVIQYADGDGNDIVYSFNGSEDLINITSGSIRNHYQRGSDVVLQIGSGNITLVGVAGQDVSIMGEDGSIYNIFGSDIGSDPGSGSGSEGSTGSTGSNGSSSGGSSGSNSSGSSGSSSNGSSGSNSSGSSGSTYNGSTFEPEEEPVAGSGLGFSVAGARMGSFNEDGSRFVYITDSGSVYFSETSGSNYDATISINSSASLGTIEVNSSSGDNNNFIFSTGLIARSWNVTMGSGNDTVQIRNASGGTFNAGSGADLFSVSSALAGDVSLTGGDGADIFYAQSANITNASYQHEVTITDLSGDDVILIDANVENLTSNFFSGDSFLNYGDSLVALDSTIIARTAINVGSNQATEGTYSTARFANSVDGSATRVVWTNSDSTNLNASIVGSGSMLIFTNSNDTIAGGIGNDTIFTGDSTNVVFNSTSGGNDLVRNWGSTDTLVLSTIPSSMSINSSGELNIANSTSSMTVQLSSGSFTNSTDINFNLNGTNGIARVATGDNEVIYGSEVTYFEGISQGTLILAGSGSANINLASTSNVTYSHISDIDASNATADLILTGDNSSNVIYAGQTATTLQGGGGNDSLIGGSGADVFIYDSSDGNVTVYSGESVDAVDLTAWGISDVNGHYRFVDGNVVFGFDTNQSLTVIGSNLINVSITGSSGSVETIDIDYGSQTFGSLDPYVPIHVDPHNTDIDDSLIGTESIGTWIDVNNIGFIPNNAPTLVGSINTTTNDYVDIGEDSVTTFSPSISALDDVDAVISIDASSHMGIIAATDDDFNLTFGGTTQIAGWTASLGDGDDQIHIINVTSGLFDGGDGHDFFNVTTRLAGNITLTGGAEEDSNPAESSNVFYAEGGTVSSSSSQRIITVSDPSFNNGDVLLIDAGVENLTRDFFDDFQFKNFATAAQASTSGAIARNVFEASVAGSSAGLTFSMIHMANRSDVTLNDYNEIDDEDLITDVVWANSNSATIDFTESQNNNVLIFTDTNGTTGDVLTLGDFYNDTIHAGANDTIDAGDGNDIISVRSGAYGKNAVINGGAGDDTITVSNATRVVFDDSEGHDVVNEWQTADKGTNKATVLEVDSPIQGASINGSGQLVITGENQTMVINSADGSFTSDTDIAYEFNGSEGIARVAGSDHVVNYDSDVTFYDGVENGTLSVDSSSAIEIELSDSDITYNNVLNIDASSATGRVTLSGNSADNVIHGGKRSSTLWGAGGNDTLIGGDGRDTFRFTATDGNVTIQNGDSNDVVDMTSFTANDIAGWEFTSSGVVIATTSDQSLTVDGTSMTTFSLNGATYTADFSNQTFNS